MIRSMHIFPLKVISAMFLRVSMLWWLGWNLDTLLSSWPIAVLVLVPAAVEAGCYLPMRCPEATREVRGTTAYIASH